MNASEKRYASNHKVTRISVHAWLFLKEMSVHTGLSMGEALDKLLVGSDHIPQMLMPVTMARSTPVTSARLIPVTSAKARSTPVTIGFSREVECVNGNRRID